MKKKKRSWILPATAAVVFLLGLGLVLYPLFSNWYAERHQSMLWTEYKETVEQTDSETLSAQWEAAEKYNRAIKAGVQTGTVQEILAPSEGYGELLNPAGDGIMGYIEIPKLSLRLSIRHGVSAEMLELGVGHLPGSSLPVGGEGTHAVLTAHSGMPGQKMFSDLDILDEGDLFFLHILGRTLAYQVDQIQVVLPEEQEALYAVERQDLCTLVTCTPFGVNTHRLLVRGKRIPYNENADSEEMSAAAGGSSAGSTWERQYLKGILTGIAIGGVLLIFGGICLLMKKPKRKNRKSD